jgi:hypothetical protein
MRLLAAVALALSVTSPVYADDNPALERILKQYLYGKWCNVLRGNIPQLRQDWSYYGPDFLLHSSSERQAVLAYKAFTTVGDEALDNAPSRIEVTVISDIKVLYTRIIYPRSDGTNKEWARVGDRQPAEGGVYERCY